MKKITKLLMLVVLAWSGQTQAQTVFFSEYAEGTSNNKYLEIYNPSSDTISLSDYILGGCGNGCSTAGIKGKWQITLMGVGPSKGDISWYSTKIDANTRGCLADDEFIFHGNGAFQNIMGSQTWLETWQSSVEGCGKPVFPHDGSKLGTWVDNKNGTFTIYGNGSHVGLPKVYNGGEINKSSDAKDSIKYEFTMKGDSSMSVYCQINGGAYWQFDMVKTGLTFEFDNTNMISGKKLAPGAVYVMANTGAQANIKAKADYTGSQPSHTGNDYWVLMNAKDASFLDEIGEMTDEATEPVNGWDVAGVKEGTKDRTLVRKPGKTMGSKWSMSAGTTAANSEWIVLDGPTATDIYGDLGTYKSKVTRVVKVSVDMKNETVSANGVHVAGNFQGWSPNGTKLNQEGSSTIYSKYTEMDPNTLSEFKFINNNDWSSGVESVPAISQKGHKNNGESNDNRWVWTGSGSDTLVLPAFMFSGAAPSGKYAVRLAVDLQKEASVNANGVHIAGDIQKAAGFPEWNPSATPMPNLFSSNKIYEVILCVADGTYAYKFVNGNSWGSDEAVPSACANNNNRSVSVSGANVEAAKVCYGSCDACPGRAIPKFKATFLIDMAKECSFEKVDIAGGKINGWAGGTYFSDNSGLSGDWKITKIGVGPSKGDIGWFSEEINATTRACMQDDRIALNKDGSFFNILGNETWIEGWQKSGANGCGTPVAPFDGSTMGTWKDHGNGTFTVYGKGSHVGIPKVVNGKEINSNADARDSVTYEYSITNNKLTTYISIGGGYWQFEYARNNSNATVWTTTILLDSGVEIAHKVRKIDAAKNVNWEGGSDRKYFVHKDTTFAVRCFGLDEACKGNTLAPSNILFAVDMSNEIPQDTVWLMGSFTSPAWQAGAIPMTANKDNADRYEIKVSNICNEYFEYKFVNEKMSSSSNGEPFKDSTDRSCVKNNGVGGFNRYFTRTTTEQVEIFFVYSSCKVGGTNSVVNLTNELRIAPNPASGNFTVSLGTHQIERVLVMSLDGRIVRSLNPANSRTDVNVDGLNGVYVVQVTDSNGNVATQKVVIQ